MLDEIKKKIAKLKNEKINRFFSNVREYDFEEYTEHLKNKKFALECVENLFNGDIFILRNTLDKTFIDNSINKLQQFYTNNSPISPKILEGCENGFYISNNTETGYRTVDRSFYFFSWNQDKLKIYNEVLKIYKKLKVLNGLSPNDVSNNTPKKGIVERLHVIHYPLGGGEISKHTDPVNISIINHGIFGSEFGTDYDAGGFYLISADGKKVEIDQKVNKGDSVIFFPGLIHGVDPVYLGDKKLDTKSKFGRWYFNFQNVETHEVKNRQVTLAVE
tara:strand:- start:463 stop:1287 length:825 start_codon:yes stop_codon:yes gene_type:complete